MGFVLTKLIPISSRFILVSRIFSLLLGFFDIYYWKAIWDGTNCLFGLNYTVAASTLGLGVLVLALAGVLSSVNSAPVGTVLDLETNSCATGTYFEHRRDSHFCLKLADVLVTVFLEMFVILAWHGMWTLEDIFTEQMNWSNEVSAWISIVRSYDLFIL